MTIPKIKKIILYPENYSFKVLFDNDVEKFIDFREKINEEFYKDLQNKDLFAQAVVDTGGYGISWNDDIDISEYELWNM